jgi:hypothetical protein
MGIKNRVEYLEGVKLRADTSAAGAKDLLLARLNRIADSFVDGPDTGPEVWESDEQFEERLAGMSLVGQRLARRLRLRGL